MKNFLIPGVIVILVAVIIGASIFSGPAEKVEEVVNQKPNEPELTHVHGFSVDVANPERLLIATHHGLLQFEGNTLSQVGTTADDLMGFTLHPTDAQIYFSSGHSARGGNLGFQKSTDGGMTWTKISDGINGPVDFHSMTVSKVNSDIVYGHFGSLQRSKDGGQTWEIAKGIIKPYMLTTHPEKENVVYAATQTGVLVSEDYGDTWNSLSAQIGSGAVSTFTLSPTASEALVFSETLQGLGRSIDGGVTWKKIAENFEGSAVSFISYDQKNPSNVYAVTQKNSIFKSTDGGDTWSKIR